VIPPPGGRGLKPRTLLRFLALVSWRVRRPDAAPRRIDAHGGGHPFADDTILFAFRLLMDSPSERVTERTSAARSRMLPVKQWYVLQVVSAEIQNIEDVEDKALGATLCLQSFSRA